MKTALYFCLNSQYLDQFRVLASSILSVGQVPADVDWFVFSPDIEDIGCATIIKTQCEYGTDIDGTPRQDCDDKLVGMRYLAAKGYDQAVYLDCDMIVTGDISELFEPMLDYDIAAVDEYFYPELLEDHPIYKDTIKINPKYFNSGVMVVNLKSMLINATVDEYDRSGDCMPSRKWRDQEWINYTFSSGRIKLLGREFNWKPEAYRPIPNLHLKEHVGLIKGARIVHFAGKSKPWCNSIMSFNFEKVQVPYSLYYRHAVCCSDNQEFLINIEKNL